MTGELMAAELAEQPEVLERIRASARGELAAICATVARAAPRFVLLAARGTSDHAALYAKYLIETRLGIPAGLVSTSTYTTYRASVRLSDVLWVAISQSGSSPDLVESTAAARAGGALTLAVTNAVDSSLADQAELVLDMQAGRERAVAATKSYTASLFVLWLLVSGWGGLGTEPADRLPALAADALEISDLAPLVARYRFAARMVTTSRGYAYATAREAALKFMETCYVQAQAFSGPDLVHGPIAMVDSQQPVLAIVPEGVGGSALRPVLERLVDLGADVCAVAPRPVPGAAAHIPVPAGVPETLAPILQVLPLQRLAHGMSLSRGHDPDRPRGLSKVTRTR